MTVQREKLVLIGAAKVGKTSIARRLCDQNYFSPAYVPTGGLEMFCTTKTSLANGANPSDTIVEVWDGSGQLLVSDNSVFKALMKDATCVMIVYDVTDKDSLSCCDTWFTLLDKSPDVSVMLVGNKTDLEHDRKVPKSTAEKVAQSHRAMTGECSVGKSNGPIDTLVTRLLTEVGIQRKCRSQQALHDAPTSPSHSYGRRTADQTEVIQSPNSRSRNNGIAPNPRGYNQNAYAKEHTVPARQSSTPYRTAIEEYRGQTPVPSVKKYAPAASNASTMPIQGSYYAPPAGIESPPGGAYKQQQASASTTEAPIPGTLVPQHAGFHSPMSPNPDLEYSHNFVPSSRYRAPDQQQYQTVAAASQHPLRRSSQQAPATEAQRSQYSGHPDTRNMVVEASPYFPRSPSSTKLRGQVDGTPTERNAAFSINRGSPTNPTVEQGQASTTGTPIGLYSTNAYNIPAFRQYGAPPLFSRGQSPAPPMGIGTNMRRISIPMQQQHQQQPFRIDWKLPDPNQRHG